MKKEMTAYCLRQKMQELMSVREKKTSITRSE